MTSDNILEARMDDRRLNNKERNGFPVCKKCGGQVLPRNDNKCIQCGYDQKDDYCSTVTFHQRTAANFRHNAGIRVTDYQERYRRRS